MNDDLMKCLLKKTGTPLVIKWLGLYPSTKGRTSLAPGQGTKIPGAVHHGKRIKKKERKIKIRISHSVILNHTGARGQRRNQQQ